jgi:hypothetical protein
LLGIEWQALTYAGHTAWNVHYGRDTHGGYEEGVKRRPRSEWLITRNTHCALITDEEAESILAKLEANPGRRSRGSDYLLSGLLVTPAGRPWHGNSGFYRAGNINIAAAPLERAIVTKFCEDLSSDGFADALLKRAKDAQKPNTLQTELSAIDRRITRLDQQVARLTTLIAETDTNRPLLSKLTEVETERCKLEVKRSVLQSEVADAKGVMNLTPELVRELLRGIANNAAQYPRERVKDLLRGTIAKITLEKAQAGSANACIEYEIPAEAGDKVASPRRFDPLLQQRKRHTLDPAGSDRIDFFPL